MAWTPIAETDIGVVFNGIRCSMTGSVVSCSGETDPSFGLGFVVPGTIRARLTWQSYTAGSGFGDVGGARLDFGVDEFTNSEPPANPQTAFTPTQAEADTSFIQYSASFGVEWGGTETWSLLVEVETPDPPCSRVVQFRYSKDGGHNWSAWRNRSLGEVGEFTKRVTMRRLGLGRQWVFEVKVTDDVKRDLMAASMQIEGGDS